MGLEFSFDEITLDQRASGDQLEIDLYDELVTISDAEPEEQVRLLAVKRALAAPLEDDKPESIRVTGSLGKDHPLAAPPILPARVAHQQFEIPVPPRPAGTAKSGALPTGYPQRPAPDPGLLAPRPLSGQDSAAVQPAGPSPSTKEIQPPRQVRPSAALGPRGPQLPGSQPLAPVEAPFVPAASTGTPSGACPDCGNPAGDLDMICIECGAFIG